MKRHGRTLWGNQVSAFVESQKHWNRVIIRATVVVMAVMMVMAVTVVTVVMVIMVIMVVLVDLALKKNLFRETWLGHIIDFVAIDTTRRLDDVTPPKKRIRHGSSSPKPPARETHTSPPNRNTDHLVRGYMQLQSARHNVHWLSRIAQSTLSTPGLGKTLFKSR